MKLSMNILSLALLAMTGVTADGSVRARESKAEMAERSGGARPLPAEEDYRSGGDHHSKAEMAERSGGAHPSPAEEDYRSGGDYHSKAEMAKRSGGFGKSTCEDPHGWYTVDSDGSNSNCDWSICSDVVGWYNSQGTHFDCAYYEENWDLCRSIGGVGSYANPTYENFGHSAKTACCICGGGVHEPCWLDGTECFASTCSKCCKGSEYWDSKVSTACGEEPCWVDGTVCGTGTTCHNCCGGNGDAECPWYGLGICSC